MTILLVEPCRAGCYLPQYIEATHEKVGSAIISILMDQA